MALVLSDRVRDITTTTGTGTVTLSGTAPNGYRSFASGVGNGNTTYYTISSDTEWEVGLGTFTSSGNTLSRDVVYGSSNSNALVNFSAGTKDVFVTYPASKAIADGYGTLPATNGGTGQTSYAVGDLLYASTTTALSKLADVATGSALISGGVDVAPSWGKVGLTTHITGTLAVGNGGTGATTLTGVLRGNGTAAFTAGNVNLASEVTGTLPVANGGTGATTLTGYVKGSGTSAFTASASIPVADVTGAAPLASPTFTGTVTTATADLLGSVRGNVTAVAASAIDCSLGNYFTKTASGALSWTVSNVPATRSYSFLLELTNGGTGTQTWFTGTKWPGGTAPTLTTSGVDVLGFITDDSGTTWRGVMLMKDSK